MYKFAACLFAALTISTSAMYSTEDLDALLEGIDFDDLVEASHDQRACNGGDGLPIDPELIFSGLQLLIKEPLWQNTRAPRGRDMLYHLPHKLTALEYGGVSVNLFFNMTNRMNVSAKSLLDLSNSIEQEAAELLLGTFICDLVECGTTTVSELTSLLPLFENLTIQEYRSGIYFQGGVAHGPLSLQFHTTFQVAARNFWLNARDQASIKNVLNRIFPGEELDESEFYRIRVGLGDTRLKLGLNTVNGEYVKIDVGTEAIFPTSLLSSKIRFDRHSQIDLDFDPETLSNSGIDLLRKMRTFLIDPRLGNGGHFGFGLYLESKIGLFRNLIQLWLRASYDKLFPARESRLIMFKQQKKDPRDYSFEERNQFLEQFVFPSSFDCEICPGGIFNLVASFNLETKKWLYALGYDLYMQHSENIQQIFNTTISMADLRITDAQAPSSIQHKIFTEFTRRKKYLDTELDIGLGGDVTVYSEGIGYDWTVYLKIAGSF